LRFDRVGFNALDDLVDNLPKYRLFGSTVDIDQYAHLTINLLDGLAACDHNTAQIGCLQQPII
jgi:hypothetical protein